MTSLAEVELENKLLKQHKDGALRELEKVTDQLFKTQDQNKALVDAVEEKKHSEQLGAWAIDRAIEEKKINKDVDVLIRAQEFCEWVMKSSAKKMEK